MVLQANGTAHIWGWAQNPTALVKVELKRGGSSVQVYYAQAENGYWIAHLVQPISFVPADIHISTPDGAQSATIQNVLFGQVYICGGQSNMQMSVSGAFNGSEEVSKADHYPNIRFFTAGQGTASSEVRKRFSFLFLISLMSLVYSEPIWSSQDFGRIVCMVSLANIQYIPPPVEWRRLPFSHQPSMLSSPCRSSRPSLNLGA